jgi:hypothetical protein
MIIGIYIVIKILVNYFMLDYNFLKKEDKSKVDEDTKINLKLISSIIYHQMITMIKSVCKIVTKIPKNVDYKQEGVDKLWKQILK